MSNYHKIRLKICRNASERDRMYDTIHCRAATRDGWKLRTLPYLSGRAYWGDIAVNQTPEDYTAGSQWTTWRQSVYFGHKWRYGKRSPRR